MCFGCSKEPSHWEGSFEYPQLDLGPNILKVLNTLQLLSLINDYNYITSVSARVRFLRFWRNKLIADTLKFVCAFFVTHTKTAARTKLRRLYVPRSEEFQVYLDDNASINIFPVENRPAHKYPCWVYPWRIWFISKTTTAHVKSHWRFAQIGVRSK